MPSQPRGRQEHHRRRAARANRTASPQAPGASSPPRRAGKTNSIATAQQGGRSGRRIFCPPGPSHFPRQHIRPPLIANNHNQKKTAPPSTTNQSIKFFRGQQQRKEKIPPQQPADGLRTHSASEDWYPHAQPNGPPAPLRISRMPDRDKIQQSRRWASRYFQGWKMRSKDKERGGRGGLTIKREAPQTRMGRKWLR